MSTKVINYLSRSTVLFLTLSTILFAQLPPTGNNEVVFRNLSGQDILLGIEPAGFLFNNELIYYTSVTNFDNYPDQLAALQNGYLERFSGSIPSGYAFGFESPWPYDDYTDDPLQDIYVKMMLAFGRYRITFQNRIFYLNLIDAGWYDNTDANVVKFLFEYDNTYPDLVRLQVYQGGLLQFTEPVKDDEEKTTWNNQFHVRNRDFFDISPIRYFFNIDGIHSSQIPIPSTNVSDLILDVNAQIRNDVTLSTNKALRIKYYQGLLGCQPTQLKITDGAVFQLENWPLLEFISRSDMICNARVTLSFEDGGSAIINHPLAMRGNGNIERANITWHCNFQIEQGDYFIFKHGGTFNFESPPNKYNMYINGKARFIGSANQYYFNDNIDTIFVLGLSNPSLYLTEDNWFGSVTFNNIPHLEVWGGATTKILGTQIRPCSLLFRSLSHVDVYGTLDAVHTVFKGRDTSKWGGILVGHSISTISLDTCIVRDISLDPRHGSAVHFYGSGLQPSRNQIRYTKIINDQLYNTEQVGDGIFLQSEFSPPARSEVIISNTCIYDKWFTGLNNVSSDVRLDSSTIYGNYQGIGCTDGVTAKLYHNCIINNKIRGLFGEFGSDISLGGSYIDFSPALNVIKNNGPNPFLWGGNQAQIVLENTSIIHGGYINPFQNLENGRDNISHSIDTMKRAYVYNSVATLQLEWWGEIPQSGCGIYGNLSEGNPSSQASRFFIIDPPNNPPNYDHLDYRYAWCDTTRDCDPWCPLDNGPIAPIMVGNDLSLLHDNISFNSTTTTNKIGMFKGVQYGSLADAIARIREYIKKNDFTSGYQILSTIINTTSDHSVASIASYLAIHFEMVYSNNNPGAIKIAGSRLLGFLNDHIAINTNSSVKAALVEALCTSLLFFDDIAQAESAIKVFRATYPFSTYTTRTLWQLLMIEMEYRDTLEVNNVINQMIKEGFSVNDLHVANSMRNAFLRIKPKEMFINGINAPKRTDRYPSTKKNVTNDIITIYNYPNPFNPSTVIEYNLPSSTHVTLKVYTLLGKEVTTLVDEVQKAGKHFVNFEVKRKSSPLPSGVYIYTLTTPEHQVTGKMNVLR